MSMLSAQVDELRSMAVSGGLEVPQAATQMMEAADTIWQLRDRAQTLQAENAKLRELVRDMWEGYNDPRCEECHLKDTPTCADCPICAREASVIDRMRELGVDV